MPNKNIIIMKHDLASYPPVIALIEQILEQNRDVEYIGGCSSKELKKEFLERGVKFPFVAKYGGNFLRRFYQQLVFRHKVKRYLKRNNESERRIWLVHFETAVLFHSLYKKEKIYTYLLEFRSSKLNLGYKVLSGFNNFSKELNKSERVICCEYNRAHLTKALFNLDRLPYVIPNKFMLKENKNLSLSNIHTDLIERYKNNKIILYQGGFSEERPLDSYINAISLLPKEYVLFLMGPESKYKDKLRSYAGDNPQVVFVPALPPPLHLEITKNAYIGIISYSPLGTNFSQMVNVLYCAPNKIFEYSQFGKPIIANDLPALTFINNKYKVGEIVPSNPLIEEIKISILKISENYSEYSSRSKEYFDSIDTTALFSKLILS